MKPNGEYLTSQLHKPQTMKNWSGPGNKAIGYKQVEPSMSGLAVLEKLHVELNSECGQHVPHSQTHYLYTLASICQATPTHVACEA